MSSEQTASEDLKAYERRLTEVVSSLQPQTRIWRLILLIVGVCCAFSAYQWLSDPLTEQIALAQSLINHWFFTLSCIIMAILFAFGIHNRVIAPQIVVSRVRNVLADFNMSCDDSGRLILRPSSKIN